MTTMLILGGFGLVLLVLAIWAACAAGGRADDDMNRYLDREKEKARKYGCATRT